MEENCAMWSPPGWNLTRRETRSDRGFATCDSGEWQRWQRRRSNTSVPGAPGGDAPYRRTPRMARLEAVFLVAEGAISSRKLAQWAMLADAAEARRLIDRLNEWYDASGAPFRIERVAAGYQMLTRPVFAFWLDKLHQRQSELKLSPPAMETLTIVAYQQPITRADIEAIRGVQCSEMLKQLMERGLVRICGEDDSLGRPFLYDTTRKFLEMFGLQSLDDLPMADRLRKIRRPPSETAETELEEDASPEAAAEPEANVAASG